MADPQRPSTSDSSDPNAPKTDKPITDLSQQLAADQGDGSPGVAPPNYDPNPKLGTKSDLAKAAAADRSDGGPGVAAPDYDPKFDPDKAAADQGDGGPG